MSSHQPQRLTDLMAYLYLIATCHAEYNLSACMAYDVAFRRKAARFRLASWGEIDPQLYTLRPSQGLAKPAPGPGVTTASLPPTLPLTALFFPLVGQPRKPGSPRLAPHRPRQGRSGVITTEKGAPGTTAHAVTCASPPVVMGHTRSPPAPSRDFPLGSSDSLSTPRPSPLPLPTLISPYLFTNSSRPFHWIHQQQGHSLLFSLFNTSNFFPHCRLTVPYLQPTHL